MRIVDIHSHILPGVDDGARDMDAALVMLRMAQESGVEAIVATPHCNIPGMEGNYAGDRLRRRFDALRRGASDAGLSIKICDGAEVFCTRDMPTLLQNGALPTLAGSRYMLLEFDFGEPAYFISDMLDVAAERGVVPVVAHPERYRAVQREPELAAEWFFDGCVLQVNKDSILGGLGGESEAAAAWLMENGLVHILASDAHGMLERTCDMSLIAEYVASRYSPEYAAILLQENPGRIINDKPLLNGND